jgi:hypothetical protein
MKILRINSEIMRDRQLAVSRELDRRGISRKVIAYDSGIKYDTLVSYFPAGTRIPSEMPCGALAALCDAESMPDDLVSLLLPDGWAAVRVPEGVDYDVVSQLCRDLIDAKDQAHHPESEEGRDLGPTERQVLAEKAVKLRIVA